MKSLTGKRVLLVAPRFFGYDLAIAEELRRRGAEVELVADRPFDSPLLKAATTYARPLMMPLAYARYRRALLEPPCAPFDLVLVVVGQTVGPRLLTDLRRHSPQARFVLYLWDSVENRRSAVANFRHFDTVFSFDPDDCVRYKLRYRPLFFRERSSGTTIAEVKGEIDRFAYDLSFIGTIHSDRYEVVSSVARALPSRVRFHRYLYLQAPWVFHVKRLMNRGMRGARRDEFNFQPLPVADVANVFRDSFAVLDIEHPLQRGLTMRTFETVGAGKKLVTTNAGVRGHDFFDERNMIVIDRHAPYIPADFFETPAVAMEPAVRDRYSIGGWLDDLLGEGQVPVDVSDIGHSP